MRRELGGSRRQFRVIDDPVDQPHSGACAASSTRSVSNISIARLSPITRANRNVHPASGTSPTPESRFIVFPLSGRAIVKKGYPVAMFYGDNGCARAAHRPIIP
jgi:hypothetical protein